MRRNSKKAALVAECVGDCWYGSANQLHILAGLLWAIAKGTRWEKDARSGIEGVCPDFFKD